MCIESRDLFNSHLFPRIHVSHHKIVQGSRDLTYSRGFSDAHDDGLEHPCRTQGAVVGWCGVRAASAVAQRDRVHEVAKEVEEHRALLPLSRLLDADDVFDERTRVAAHRRLLEPIEQSGNLFPLTCSDDSFILTRPDDSFPLVSTSRSNVPVQECIAKQ